MYYQVIIAQKGRSIFECTTRERPTITHDDSGIIDVFMTCIDDLEPTIVTGAEYVVIVTPQNN